MLLLAPIKLPGKALNIIKYVAVGLGIMEAVTRKEVNPDEVGTGELSSEQVNEDILSDNERVSESVNQDK